MDLQMTDLFDFLSSVAHVNAFNDVAVTNNFKFSLLDNEITMTAKGHF
jgi:hypothetical protein